MNRLDLEGLSFSCFTSGAVVARYTCNILAFPLLAVWMWLCFAMSKLLPYRRLRWTPTKTLNSIGSLLQMGYGPMCMLALQPFMCYTHPNGSQSLLRQPGVFCGEGDHRAMLLGGCLLLVLIGWFWKLVRLWFWLHSKNSPETMRWRYVGMRRERSHMVHALGHQRYGSMCEPRFTYVSISPILVGVIPMLFDQIRFSRCLHPNFSMRLSLFSNSKLQ